MSQVRVCGACQHILTSQPLHGIVLKLCLFARTGVQTLNLAGLACHLIIFVSNSTLKLLRTAVSFQRSIQTCQLMEPSWIPWYLRSMTLLDAGKSILQVHLVCAEMTLPFCKHVRVVSMRFQLARLISDLCLKTELTSSKGFMMKVNLSIASLRRILAATHGSVTTTICRGCERVRAIALR